MSQKIKSLDRQQEQGATLDGEPVLECEATPASAVGIYDIVVKKGRKIKGQVAKKGVYVVDGKKVVTPGTPGT